MNQKLTVFMPQYVASINRLTIRKNKTQLESLFSNNEPFPEFERTDHMRNPIRVLQVVTHMNRGGLETMLMNYYRHIDRERVQFDFLVHRFERAAYDDEIESLGGIIHRLPRLVPWSPSYLNALNQFFSSHPEYQIVHVHQDCLSSVALKAAKKHGIPVRIAHSHSSSQDKNLKYLIKLFYKHFIPKYATHLLACGTQAGNWMFSGHPFVILNNAIDASAYSFDPILRQHVRTSLGVSSNIFLVGHVGRFSPPKNHIYLMDIFTELHKKEPNAVLLLVGDGELRQSIEQKVQALGLSDYVIFTGIRSDVNQLMQAMDVFVFPSLYEGLPVTMVEAQAAGLPCFISDKVPPECILTGLVTQIPLEESPEKWTKSIYSVRGSKRTDTYSEITQAGFDIRKNAAWLEGFYLDHQSKS